MLSLARILLIPVFVTLIVHRPTSRAGLILFGCVAATDWVDGYVARRSGQISELGKLLDPTADRLAIAAGLIALVARGVFPLWAALLILVRDAVVLLVGAMFLATGRARIDVRFVGKLATFTLVCAIGAIAWANLRMPLARLFLGIGWVCFAFGIVEYYVATWAYVGDLRSAVAGSERPGA